MKLKIPHFKIVILFLLVCGNNLTAQSNNLVVIDKDYEQKEKLLTKLPENVSVLNLDGTSNPWKTIRETLEQNKNIENIHLFAESASNSITMGGIVYTNDMVETEFELSMLEGLYESKNYQLLLYTCNLPSSDSGLDLISKIGNMAYFNVAASTKCTDVFDQLTFDYTSLNQPTVAPIFK